MFSAALNISKVLRRAPRTLAVVGLVAVLALLGAGQARTQSLDSTSTTLSVIPTSIALGDTVTFTATVTGTTAPVGFINFTSQQNGGAVNTFASVSVSAINATQSQATFSTNSFPAGSYTIVAKFRTSDSGSWSNSSSAGQILAVGAVVIHNTAMALNMQPLTVNQGDSADIIAHVTTTDGSGVIPTGVVDFHSIDNGHGGSEVLLGDANLDGTGTATLHTTSWLAGSYTILASYQGDAFDHAAGAQLTIAVGTGEQNKALTTTVVVASPQSINTGDSVTFDAYVAQTNSTLSPPAGDAVEFKANGVFIGQANLNSAGHAILTVGGWLEGKYQIEADYVGDLFYATSAGQTTVSVTTPKPTRTTYTGGTTVVYGGQVTLSGHLVDASSGAALGNQLLRIGVNAGHPGGELDCSGQTDSSGNFSCTVADTLAPGSYPIAVAFDGSGAWMPSGDNSTLVVSPLPTTTTAGDVTTSTGAPTTLTGHLVDTNGNPLPAGTSVTLTVQGGGGESCTGVTDATGNVSCVITPSEGTGTYTITAAFAGTAIYLASSGNGTLTVVGAIPTTLTYTGATTVVQGHAVHVSFVLRNANTNAVLANMPVTVTFDGGTYNVTSDAGGNVVISPDPTVNDAPGSNLPATASFAGKGAYLASSGAGSVLVTGIPTTLTYTGATTVVQGKTAHVSFVLRNANTNAVLANMPVTITFDGGTYNVTSDAGGNVVVSPDPTVNDAPGSNLPATASFAGQSPYLPSTGSGNVYVTSPTSLTYTGPSVVTEGANGGKTNISFVLKDGQGNLLSGKTVTLGFGAQSCTGVTNASGSVSCLVNTPAPGQPGGYIPTAGFAGTAAYGSSNGTGSFIVTAPTNIVYTGDVNAATGTVATLSGVLTDGVTGLPLAGKTVTLSFSTTSCTAVTDATGLATCQITVPATTGPITAIASFAGDTYYGPSTNAKSGWAYGLAPGTGVFVVGDLTDTGNVYFWGSQWWKINQLSAGDKQAVDPGAFKGYAATPHNPVCGQTWATDPGNSTPPPNAPLPAYMAIIVTSQNHKAPGKIITGDVVHIVIVKTDPGYDSNPGHDGTGTVVATVC